MFCSQSVASEDVKRDDQEGSDPDRKIENVEHAGALRLTTVETQTTNVEVFRFSAASSHGCFNLTRAGCVSYATDLRQAMSWARIGGNGI